MDLSVTLAVIGLVVNTIGLGFVAIQVALGRRQIQESQKIASDEHSRLRRQGTIDFYMATVEQRSRWRATLPEDWNQQAIRTFLVDAFESHNQAKLDALTDYFGYLEGLAVAIAAGVYDLDTIDAVVGDRLIAIAKNYRPFFDESRLRRGVPALYVEFEWLADKLTQLRAANDEYILYSEREKLPLSGKVDRESVDDVTAPSVSPRASDAVAPAPLTAATALTDSSSNHAAVAPASSTAREAP